MINFLTLRMKWNFGLFVTRVFIVTRARGLTLHTIQSINWISSTKKTYLKTGNSATDLNTKLGWPIDEQSSTLAAGQIEVFECLMPNSTTTDRKQGDKLTVWHYLPRHILDRSVSAAVTLNGDDCPPSSRPCRLQRHLPAVFFPSVAVPFRTAWRHNEWSRAAGIASNWKWNLCHWRQAIPSWQTTQDDRLFASIGSRSAGPHTQYAAVCKWLTHGQRATASGRRRVFLRLSTDW